MNLDDLNDFINGIDVEPFTPLQKANIKKRYGNNLNMSGVGIYVDPNFEKDYLAFESESTYKNWQYYAGLEYISKDDISVIIKFNGDFLCLIDRYSCDRIEEIFDTISDDETED